MFLDARLYRTPRWSLWKPKDYDMLVPQELLNTVIFLGERTGDGVRLSGTGYFVSVAAPHTPGVTMTYLVTAAHCVLGRTDVVARLNWGDTTIFVELPDGEHWLRHPGPASGEDHVDLAAIAWPDPEATYREGYGWVPMSMFFDEAVLGNSPNDGVGLGDEVVAIGLLSVHSGNERNAPVIGTGNISLIPREPVLVRYKNGPSMRMRLYLTELRSIGGLSGSPVFVRHRHSIGEPMVAVSLLGTMIGHWDDPDSNHMGFGKVVPAHLLAELLNQEDAVKDRRTKEDAQFGGPVAKADDVGESTEFDRFEDLTRKLVSVPKKELDEKRKDES